MNNLKQFYNNLFEDITTVPQSLQPNHFPALDGLRGLAILLLIFGHFGVNYYLWPYGLLISGITGVHMFFVLSGFLITTLLIKEKLRNGRISLKNFYFRRALRILPVAWLFLLVLMGLNRLLQLQVSAFDFNASFLFLKNLPMPNELYTAHFWSLAVEVQFYLTFPVLLAINFRWYIALLLLAIIVVPAICLADQFQFPILHTNVVLHFFTRVCKYVFWKGPLIILIGSVFSVLMFKTRSTNLKGNRFISAILLIIAIVIHTKTFVFYTKYLSEYLSAILVGFAIINMLRQPNDVLARLLSTVVFTTLGLLSYSIYIWQQLFIGPANLQPWMAYFSHLPVWVIVLVKLLFLFIIVSFSFAFEAKFLKLKDKFHYSRKSSS